MLASVDSCVLVGLEARRVEVQAHDGRGEVAFVLVGMATTAVKEARERVRSAIRNSQLQFPGRRLTVNLAPAELRKEGSGLDLPIAVATALAVMRKAPPPRSAFLGELALDGSICHVNGVLVAASWLRTHGYERLFVPAIDAPEAALVEGLEVIPCTNLAGVIGHLTHVQPIEPQPPTHPVIDTEIDAAEHDLSEVHGQEEARRALEVAAAGGHHLLLSGPPGAAGC